MQVERIVNAAITRILKRLSGYLTDAPADGKSYVRKDNVWVEATVGGGGHTQNTDTNLGALSTKNPPIDADKVIYRNSASSDALVTSTWTQIKSFLKTYFDGIYSTLGLGETSGTAYRGDRGKTAYDHSQSTHAPTDAINQTTANGLYAPIVTKYIIGEEGINVSDNAFIAIYQSSPFTPTITFVAAPADKSLVVLKVVNIDSSGSVLLDFGGKLNWNPATSSGDADITLINSDNGSSFIFQFFDLGGGEAWWYQIL